MLVKFFYSLPLLFKGILNEYCLANGATLPFIHLTSASNPKTGKLSRNCVLKSFLKDSFFPIKEHLNDQDEFPDEKALNNGYPEFFEAKSTQVKISFID